FDEAPGKQKIAGALVSDLARQKNGDDRRKKADFHFRVTELRLGHGNGEVAESCNAAAAGEGMTVHRGDERLWIAPDASEHSCHATRIFLVFLRRLLRKG